MKRIFFRILCSCLIALVFCGCNDKKKLHISIWGEYLSPQIIASFEEKFNCQVVFDYYDSTELMYEKISSGASGYDVVLSSCDYVHLLRKNNFISSLEMEKLPNVKNNFDTRFAHYFNDMSLCDYVPYTIAYGIFIFDKDKIPKGADPTSWSIFENPALRNKMTLLDSPREVLGGALMANGFSISSTNAEEIDQAVETVLKWRSNIRTFIGDGYKYDIFQGVSYFTLGYSPDGMQFLFGNKEDGFEAQSNIMMAFPKEGFSISLDEFVIPKVAKERDLAHAFLNYLYDPEVAKINMEYILTLMPVKPAIGLLPTPLRDALMLPNDVAARGQVLRPLDDSTLLLYKKAWERIR